MNAVVREPVLQVLATGRSAFAHANAKFVQKHVSNVGRTKSQQWMYVQAPTHDLHTNDARNAAAPYMSKAIVHRHQNNTEMQSQLQDNKLQKQVHDRKTELMIGA